ncbi:MAG: outer membrane protein assembly factor BamE [Methylotenera sp.]|nr:outer membrane protein assembly factor BamE [Methylotenera sp.]
MCNLSIFRYPIILLAILCASCGAALPTVKPYKLDVQQGNVVTSKMLLQLRPGMTQSQVRFIMGTPLIQDSFHGKRWDYVYQMREKGKIIEQRRVILDFENQVLKTVRGDVVPKGSELVKSAEDATNTGPRVINPNAKPEEKSFLSKLKFWEKNESELAEEAAVLEAKEKADLVSKNTTELAKENITTVDDSAKPLMAVPLEILPAVESPAIIAESSAVAPAGLDASPINDIKEKEKEKEIVHPSLATTNPPALPAAEQPETVVSAMPEAKLSTAYHSPSGMQFDRTLRLAPEDIKPLAKPDVIAPRAGNKTIPKPKDLPAENSPSFFDRMLEKIGF